MAALAGRTILVIEDEPLILLDLSQALEKAGATVLSATTADAALQHMECPSVAAAVLDWMADGICQRLIDHGLPFVIHTGRSASELGDGIDAPIVRKPASSSEVIAALEVILQR
jgi:DNA-binding response OmpR family regulator